MTTAVGFRIRVGKHSKKPLIWVTFPYNPGISDMLKEVVQGLRWSGKEKMWTAPLDMESARDIRQVARHFGANLQIEPELAVWALKERDKISNLLRPDDMSADSTKLLPLVREHYPHIIKAMESQKPWQIPGAAFIVSQKNVVVADQPGLGKTLQVLAALIELQVSGAILVVAPKTACEVTWPDEIARWLGPEHIFRIIGSIKPQQRRELVTQAKALAETGERVWILTGPDYLRVKAETDEYGNYLRDAKGDKVIRAVGHTVPDLFHIPYSVVIVDESQQVLATNTGNKKRWSAQRTGMGVLDVVPGSVRIAISGTPFRGKTEMIWGTLAWLDPKKYTSYWKWVRRHYGVVDAFHNETQTHLEKGDTIRDEKRFFNELRPILIRRTHRELRKMGFITGQKFYGGTHLDPNDESSPIAVWLPLAPKQAKQYKQIVDDAVIGLQSLAGEQDEVVVNGSLAEMVRFKQVAGSTLGIGIVPEMPSAKIDWTIDFLRERIANGTKTVVASQFTQFIELLSRECTKAKIPHYVFTGKTSGKDRVRITHEFQSEGGEMVVLLNTKSGGLSLTLDAADDVVVCDQTWIPDDQEQVENRAYGRERDHDVNVWNLCSVGTIDEDIAVLNCEREGEIFSVLDSQRGVSYVKALVAMTMNRTGIT